MSDLHFSPINPISVQANILRGVNRVLSLFSSSGKSTMPPIVDSELSSPISFYDRGRSALPQRGLNDSPDSDGSRSPRQSLTRSSSLSIPFEDAEVDVVRVEGLRHAEMRLEAR